MYSLLEKPSTVHGVICVFLLIFEISDQKGNPISVICLNECWLSEIRDGSNLNLTNYNLFNQIGKCTGHSHCGLLIYVHEDYTCNELIINQMTTGWEYLCIEISHNSPNSRKYIISNIYRPPEKYIEELDIFIE